MWQTHPLEYLLIGSHTSATNTGPFTWFDKSLKKESCNVSDTETEFSLDITCIAHYNGVDYNIISIFIPFPFTSETVADLVTLIEGDLRV